MRDLRSHKLIVLKAVLFLVLGGFSVGILLWDAPTLKTAALLGIAIWAFARAYYFVFYVIEHYIDPGYHFSGLLSAGRYLLTRRRR